MKTDDLVDNPFKIWEDAAEERLPKRSLAIYQFIEDQLKREESANVLRGSAATMCVRRRWYQGKGFIGKPLTPRKILNFISGDLAEAVMAYFVQQALVGADKPYASVFFGKPKGFIKVRGRDLQTYEQIEAKFDLHVRPFDPASEKLGEVVCHFDGIAMTNDNEFVLLEFKSASDYGFKEFQDEGAGDYIKQSHSYMLTETGRKFKIRRVDFFYFRKSTGHIWDKSHYYDKETAKQVHEEFIKSIGEEAPGRPFEKEKNTVGFPCTYCPYLEECQGKHEIVWKKDRFGNMKPNYIFKE